jgi:DNA mismatch repair protein MutL
MGKIVKLPESLIRLIAAGEVIERPASVVKELVENSLDAGAASISIDLSSAGRTRIRVSDDGSGMTREDAEMALDRHATSKLREFNDLQQISTFGFRGEALPSIAAVSRLELSTRPEGADQGWALRLEGGKLLSAKAVGLPRGTTLDVQDLFFNTPARSKFLKRDSTERSHILKTLQEIALAHPAVRFEVVMDEKTILSLAPSRELGGRIADLWGLSVAEHLVAADVSRGPCTIRGFVNAIPAHHPTKAYQVLFVNRRPVFQRMLNHAVYEAYRGWLPVGRHPVYCLFIDLDPALVDVNVHPTKREVRIADERAVYDLLYTSIRNLFKTVASVPSFSSFPAAAGGPVPLDLKSTGRQSHSGMTSTIDPGIRMNDGTVAERAAVMELQAPLAYAEQTSQVSFADLHYLGQFHKLYLLFEEGEELVLMDQHAASERVLYERLLAGAAGLPAGRQGLLTPLVWDVTPAQAETVRSFLPELAAMGFLLEEFGPSSFALKEWPAVLPETKQAKRFLEEVLEDFQNEKPATRMEIQHQIAARAACRAAVMANDALSSREVMQLLEDLSACEHPMTCPHGRPTHIRLTLAELHRRVRRT